ncbi:antibiotic biosynthesis monooxygenase [Iodidimonas sp. SYSU 1G8]|uniref:antibiotic biosynthesis monooxygenase family protein n=1 Tax=Iodidimonas sp. SYSU 1G8 TaxID=3133967 RepID=UPI0031FEE05F
MEKGAWAAIFTSRLTDDAEGYAEVSERMEELVRRQPGYLGHESTRDPYGSGITVSYWASEESLKAWRDQAEHLAARKMGRERFYEWFRLDMCRVERTYGFERE